MSEETCQRELDVEITGAPMEDICGGEMSAFPGTTDKRCRRCGVTTPSGPLSSPESAQNASGVPEGTNDAETRSGGAA